MISLITFYFLLCLCFQVFSNLQERVFTEYILKCSKMNYGLSIHNIRCLAYEYARKCDVQYPVHWNEYGKATKDWHYGFMKRHPNLSLRKPQPTSSNRIKGFCKENVEEFFINLKTAFDEHKFEPHRIWNLDEMGFTMVPTKGVKVVAQKG